MVVEYKTLLNIIRVHPKLTDVMASYIINNKLPGWEDLAYARSQYLYIEPLEFETILRSNNTIG
jgi:hypothetical protein